MAGKKPHLESEYWLAILCGSHHCYFSLASGAQGWVRNSVAAEAIMNNAQHPVPPSSPQTHDIGIESASAIPERVLIIGDIQFSFKTIVFRIACKKMIMATVAAVRQVVGDECV